MVECLVSISHLQCFSMVHLGTGNWVKGESRLWALDKRRLQVGVESRGWPCEFVGTLAHSCRMMAAKGWIFLFFLEVRDFGLWSTSGLWRIDLVTGAKRAGSISAEQSFAQGVARAAPLGRAGEAISGGGKGARRRSEGVAACQHISGWMFWQIHNMWSSRRDLGATSDLRES
jgi:hypothetical protein